MKVDENLFILKAYGENSFIEKTYVLGTHTGNPNVYKQNMFLKISKLLWSLYLSSIMSIVFASTFQTANQY